MKGNSNLFLKSEDAIRLNPFPFHSDRVSDACIGETGICVAPAVRIARPNQLRRTGRLRLHVSVKEQNGRWPRFLAQDPLTFHRSHFVALEPTVIEFQTREQRQQAHPRHLIRTDGLPLIPSAFA